MRGSRVAGGSEIRRGEKKGSDELFFNDSETGRGGGD